MKLFKTCSALLGMVSVMLACSASAAVHQSKNVDQRDGAGDYVKPHAPVDVGFKLLSAAVPGQPLQVEVTLRPAKLAQAVSADVRTGPGMAVRRRGKVERLNDPARPMATRQVVTLVPSVEGLHHLTVFAKVQMNGQVQSRVVSFPIQVGKSRVPVLKMEPEMGELKPDGAGGYVRDLPAVQTVKPAHN